MNIYMHPTQLKLYQAFFSDHNAVKIRYQLQETNCKKHKHIEANSMLLSNQEVTEEVKKKKPRNKCQ